MSLQRVDLATAEKFVKIAVQAKRVPYVAGSPGCGKSKMVESVARQANLKMIDIRLAQEDPTTINGFPSLDGGRSKYLPPALFPLKGDALPIKEGHEAAYSEAIKAANGDKAKIKAAMEQHCYAGWLVFFDELPSAPRSVQAAAYKIILDRLIGNTPLHDRCYLVAAGNLMTDGAIVNEIGTALRSRMIHIHVDSQPENYLTLAAKLGVDTRIISYLAYKKQNVNNFKQFQAGSSDETFACERTWEFASDLLKVHCPNQSSPVPDDIATLLAGTVGSSALEFVTFTHAFKDLPTFDEIIKNPKTAMMPEKPAVRWLLAGMLVGNADMQNLDPIMDYVARLPKEFQFVTVKMLWGKNDNFLDNVKVQDCFSEIGDMLLA